MPSPARIVQPRCVSLASALTLRAPLEQGRRRGAPALAGIRTMGWGDVAKVRSPLRMSRTLPRGAYVDEGQHWTTDVPGSPVGGMSRLPRSCYPAGGPVTVNDRGRDGRIARVAVCRGVDGSEMVTTYSPRSPSTCGALPWYCGLVGACAVCTLFRVVGWRGLSLRPSLVLGRTYVGPGRSHPPSPISARTATPGPPRHPQYLGRGPDPAPLLSSLRVVRHQAGRTYQATTPRRRRQPAGSSIRTTRCRGARTLGWTLSGRASVSVEPGRRLRSLDGPRVSRLRSGPARPAREPRIGPRTLGVGAHREGAGPARAMLRGRPCPPRPHLRGQRAWNGLPRRSGQSGCWAMQGARGDGAACVNAPARRASVVSTGGQGNRAVSFSRDVP